MAIGTAAAIGIGLAGVGSALSSRSQSKAAGKAADTSMAVAQQNNALTRDIYNQNKGMLSPFVERGNAAGDTMNALLGLGGTPQMGAQTLPAQQPATAMPTSGGAGLTGYAAALQSYNPNSSRLAQLKLGGVGGIDLQQPQQAAPQAQQAGVNPQQSAENAFDIFRNSTGYQFRLGEGMNALNSGYAGAGVLQSGDAMRSANEYGQNFASNEFGNFTNLLNNQQQMGLGGASALAGVGQNFAGMTSQNNNSAGTAAANAQLIAGQNNPFANALGMAGGFMLGR